MPDVLINKQYKEYTYLSRYTQTPIYYNQLDNKYVTGTQTNLNDTTPCINHRVEQNDTLDKLALQYYNNPTKFWIIADFNRILNPYEPLKIGTILKIPVVSTLEFLNY